MSHFSTSAIKYLGAFFLVFLFSFGTAQAQFSENTGVCDSIRSFENCKQQSDCSWNYTTDSGPAVSTFTGTCFNDPGKKQGDIKYTSCTNVSVTKCGEPYTSKTCLWTKKDDKTSTKESCVDPSDIIQSPADPTAVGNSQVSGKNAFDSAYMNTGKEISIYKDTVDTSERKIENVVAQVINYILGFLGVVFMLIILYAGSIWLTANGNSETIDRAKSMIVNGVIGIFIISGAYSLVSYVTSTTSDNLNTNGVVACNTFTVEECSANTNCVLRADAPVELGRKNEVGYCENK